MIEQPKIKICLIGGAFDPPHQGHICLAKAIQPFCDQIWLTPCFNHLFGKNMTPADRRIDMCKLAAQAMPGLVVATHEIDEQSTDGSYDIMTRLASRFNSYKFLLVIGQDNADKFKDWKSNRKLRNRFPFIVVPRKGYPISVRNIWYKRPPHIYLTDSTVIESIPHCSSSQIRAELTIGRTPEHLDPLVFEYIKQYKLYGWPA